MDDRIDKRIRIYDMMLSIHSLLAIKYKRYANITDGVTISLSVAIISFTFANNDILLPLGIEPTYYPYIIGFSSIAILILTLITTLLNFKEKASDHLIARKTLSDIKAVLIKHSGQSLEDNEVQLLLDRCSISVSSLPQIPEDKFVKLKSYHEHKKHLSRIVGKNPGMPYIICKIAMYYNSIKNCDL